MDPAYLAAAEAGAKQANRAAERLVTQAIGYLNAGLPALIDDVNRCQLDEQPEKTARFKPGQLAALRCELARLRPKLIGRTYSTVQGLDWPHRRGSKPDDIHPRRWITMCQDDGRHLYWNMIGRVLRPLELFYHEYGFESTAQWAISARVERGQAMDRWLAQQGGLYAPLFEAVFMANWRLKTALEGNEW